ncbi:SpoIIE family protein phosphatase [Streptosporangium sp. NPDC051023]|uniref:PP2C family protein-serine/threonine phosphatase n=1 Tax=Streptosporangium sp. NPDC051023 TaxID=3155410 RepID=UPI0034502C74
MRKDTILKSGNDSGVLPYGGANLLARAVDGAHPREGPERLPAAAGPGFSTAAPGLSTTDPGLSTADPGLSSVAPGLFSADPGLCAVAVNVQAMLDVMPGCASWAVPLRDESGTIVDFLHLAATPEAEDIHGRRGADLVGVSTRQTYPSVVGTPLWQAFLRVVETGTSECLSGYEHVEDTDGVPHRSSYSLRIARLAGGLLNSWTRDDVGQRFEARLARTERLGNLGWGRWNLVTGEIVWSSQLYLIHGRDPADGPLTLEDYSTLVHPDDVAVIERATEMWARSPEPHEFEVRVRVGGGLRNIRVSAEATHDAAGRPLEIYGVVQDVTDWRRTADDLATANRLLEEENRLTAHLQNIIMPVQTEPYVLPGLRVSARYQPAETVAYLGGDWYQVIDLGDGDVLLAVGDVAGHGLAAASAMAKLRHAITGLAFAGHDPAQILTALNRLLCRLRPDVLATALVARYSTADRTLRWTHAGHPPMLLARGARIERLLHPGVLLGVFEDAAYTCGAVRLRPDDLLVMFTDGLIERRGRDIYEGLDLMSDALTEALRPSPTDRLAAAMEAIVPGNETDDTCLMVTQITEVTARAGRRG